MKIILIQETVDETCNTLSGQVLKSKHMVTATNEVELAHYLAWCAETISQTCVAELIQQCKILQDK